MRYQVQCKNYVLHSSCLEVSQSPQPNLVTQVLALPPGRYMQRLFSQDQQPHYQEGWEGPRVRTITFILSVVWTKASKGSYQFSHRNR